MYSYLLAWLPWGSCGWYDPTVLQMYHYIYIIFYVVLHIGLAAMSLVWLMCSCTMPYVLLLHVLSYVSLRISLAAMGLVWLIWSYSIANLSLYIYNILCCITYWPHCYESSVADVFVYHSIRIIITCVVICTITYQPRCHLARVAGMIVSHCICIIMYIYNILCCITYWPRCHEFRVAGMFLCYSMRIIIYNYHEL